MFCLEEGKRTEIMSKEEKDNRKELTCPMVFLDKENYLTNSTPITESLDMCYTYLDYCLGNKNDNPMDITNKNYLWNLSDVSRENTIYNIVNKIINDTLKSVASALEQSYIGKTGILSYTKTIEKINEFVNSYSNDMYHLFANYYGDIYSAAMHDKKDVYLFISTREFQRYSAQFSNNIFLGIISRINAAIEKSVDETIDHYMVLDMVPGNDNPISEKLKYIIINIFKGIDKNANEHFWTYSKYAIAKAIHEEVSLSYDSILTNINYATMNLDVIAYALLYDAINLRQRQNMIEEENNKNKIEKKTLDF